MGQALFKLTSHDPEFEALDEPLPMEVRRLAAVRRLGALDTAPEEPFDNVVSLVRTVLSVPMATVTLIDEHRQWFKARSGIPDSETPREDSICTHTIQDCTPLLVPDVRKDDRFANLPSVKGGVGIRSYAGIPLITSDGYNIGALCALDTQPRNFNRSEVGILENFAGIVVKELELRHIAHKDQLTGALTRRGFVERVHSEIGRVRRYGGESCLVMFDLDHFKAINDTHGHPSGDTVLRSIAERIIGMLRPCDAFGRIGGEEFALLLPEIGKIAGLRVADRVRNAIAATPIALEHGLKIQVSASFGVAALREELNSPEDWMRWADQPLYRAKRNGRNRCEHC